MASSDFNQCHCFNESFRLVMTCVLKPSSDLKTQVSDITKSQVPDPSLFTLIIGSFPVMHSLVNECYPTEIRTQSIALTDTICLGFGAINLKVYPNLEKYVEFHGAILMYTILSLILASWGAYTIPDNRGKSLVKVEETFEKNSNIKDNSQ